MARRTTFIHSINVVRQLETNVDEDYLNEDGQFIMMDVTDLFTMIPRPRSLTSIGSILYGTSKME